jgi:hypothetical protein
MSRLWVIGLSGGLAAAVAIAPASAREAAGGVNDFAVIANEDGDSRILFRSTELTLPEAGVAIQRALLRFSMQGEAVPRRSEIRIFPVVRDWNPRTVDWDGWQEPGGDFDRELYARKEIEFSRGSHELAVDVTLLMKEIYEGGLADHGFIVSVADADGEGIRSEDVSRYQGLANARVEIEYRSTTGPPPRVARDLAQAQRREGEYGEGRR